MIFTTMDDEIRITRCTEGYKIDINGIFFGYSKDLDTANKMIKDYFERKNINDDK